MINMLYPVTKILVRLLDKEVSSMRIYVNVKYSPPTICK